jgi:hypothetical protein
MKEHLRELLYNCKERKIADGRIVSLLATFGRQPEAFEPAIPKGTVFETVALPGCTRNALCDVGVKTVVSQ